MRMRFGAALQPLEQTAEEAGVALAAPDRGNGVLQLGRFDECGKGGRLLEQGGALFCAHFGCDDPCDRLPCGIAVLVCRLDRKQRMTNSIFRSAGTARRDEARVDAPIESLESVFLELGAAAESCDQILESRDAFSSDEVFQFAQ